MYITENQKVGESVLFLLCARNALKNTVIESKHENVDKMVDFLMNESSDYEIMSLLVTGKLPDEKYDIAAESYLFSIMKEQVLREHALVTEAVGNDIFDSFMHEVDQVFPAISTARPMLELYQEQAKFLDEQSPTAAGLKGVMKTAKDYYGQGGGGEAVGSALKTAGKFWKKKGQEAGEYAGKAGAKVSQAAGDAGEAAGGALKTAGKFYAKAGSDAVSGGKAAIEKGLPQFKAWATSPAGQGLGGAALAALVAFGAVKAYKRFFSAAAKQCAGQSGQAKTACMAKAKASAKAKKAAFIQAGSGACAKSKNPEKCKAALRKKAQAG